MALRPDTVALAGVLIEEAERQCALRPMRLLSQKSASLHKWLEKAPDTLQGLKKLKLALMKYRSQHQTNAAYFPCLRPPSCVGTLA